MGCWSTLDMLVRLGVGNDALPSLRAWAAAFKVQGLWCKVSMTKNARLDRTGMNQCAQVRVGNGTLTLRPLTGTHCVGGVL